MFVVNAVKDWLLNSLYVHHDNVECMGLINLSILCYFLICCDNTPVIVISLTKRIGNVHSRSNERPSKKEQGHKNGSFFNIISRISNVFILRYKKVFSSKQLFNNSFSKTLHLINPWPQQTCQLLVHTMQHF